MAGVLLPLLLIPTDMRRSVGKYLRRGQSAEEFNSLTGRLPVYALGYRRAKESMMLGRGFGAGRFEPIQDGWQHTHNLLLESNHRNGRDRDSL